MQGLGWLMVTVEFGTSAKVGHIRMYRDEETKYCELNAVWSTRRYWSTSYLCSRPDAASWGGSYSAVIPWKNVALCTISNCLLGISVRRVALWLTQDVDHLYSSLDDHLNEHGYIVPGHEMQVTVYSVQISHSWFVRCLGDTCSIGYLSSLLNLCNCENEWILKEKNRWFQ